MPRAVPIARDNKAHVTWMALSRRRRPNGRRQAGRADAPGRPGERRSHRRAPDDGYGLSLRRMPHPHQAYAGQLHRAGGFLLRTITRRLDRDAHGEALFTARRGSRMPAIIFALDSACLARVSSVIIACLQVSIKETAMPELPKSFSPRDGRQSDMALLVARGTRRLLRRLNFATVTELPLLSGRRADIVALARDATIFIVEIKFSVADFRADTKWRDYRAHCDRLFFAIPETLPIAIMPEDAGLILADAFGAEILWQRRSIASPPPPAARCSCVLRTPRRTGCIA